MRLPLLASALVALAALGGCMADAYNLGAGSTGPLVAEPDPFELLGPEFPMGVRLDLAAARETPSAPYFDDFLRRFVRGGAPGPSELALELLARTDVAAIGMRPGRGNDATEVLVLRGRYAGLDVEARWGAYAPLAVGEHRGRRLLRTEDGTFAVLDEHVMIVGDHSVVPGIIDHYLDHTRPVPGTPAVASGGHVEDALFIAVALPTPRIREELARSAPYERLAPSLERFALRVTKTTSGVNLELVVNTSSEGDARAVAAAVQEQIAEVARDPYAEVTGLSALLRAVRVRVRDGDLRIVGDASDADLADFGRRFIELMAE